MRNFFYFLFFVNSLFICNGQSFERAITKVSINGTEFTSFPINYTTNDNSPLSVTVFFTYRKTDGYNHSYGPGGKFFINGNVVALFVVPNLDNNQPWSSSVNSPSVPIANVNYLDLKIRITTQAPGAPNPYLTDYDTQTVRVNLTKPVGNNTISTTTPEINYYGSDVTAVINGSVPSGGNGSFAYKWYKKKWNESSFSEIIGANSKDLTVSLNQNTTYYRKVISNNGNTYSNSNHLKIKVLRPNGITLNTINVLMGFVKGNHYYDLKSHKNPKFPVGPFIDGNIISYTPFVGPEFANFDWDKVYTIVWQKSSDGNNWADINNSNVLEYNLINHFSGFAIDINNFYIRRKVSSEHVSQPSYSNVVYINLVNSPYLANNAIFNYDPNSNSISGSVPTGGNNSYLYSWYFKCSNEPNVEYKLLYADSGDSTPGSNYSGYQNLKNVKNTLLNSENIYNKNCNNNYKVIRSVASINTYNDALATLQKNNSNEINITGLPLWEPIKQVSLISNQNKLILITNKTFLNEKLNIKIWSVNNNSYSEDFNIFVSSEQIQLKQMFKNGIYIYKIFKENELLNQGKLIIK